MISRNKAASRAPAAAGFTLIELLIVLAIISLALSIVATAGRPVSPATEARIAARELAGALRMARSQALMSNRSAVFALDVVGHDYRWGGEAPKPLPPDLQLAVLTSTDQVVSNRVGQFRFDPDGGASGGRITIAGGDRIWWVGIDWLTGRVSVEEKPH
jgi:general secretion pathway protein H